MRHRSGGWRSAVTNVRPGLTRRMLLPARACSGTVMARTPVGRQGAQGQQQAHLSERSAWRVPASPCTAHDGRAPGGLRSSDYCRSFNRFGCPQSGQQFTSERRVNFPQCSQRRRSRMGRSWGFVGRVGAAVVRLSHLMQRTYGRVGSARTSDPHLSQYMAVIMIGSSRSASLPHVGFMMRPGAAAG